MARVSSLLAQAEELQSQWLDGPSRYIDFAVQFREVARSGAGVEPTGRLSPVYGGRWDKHGIGDDGTPGRFDGPALDVHVLDANPAQFEVLCDDSVFHHLVVGSRRSSKTELLARWQIKQIAKWPKKALSCLVQKHKKARKLAEEKLIPLCRHSWLGSGDREQQRGQRVPGYTRGDEVSLTFITRTKLDFLSGRVPDDARGDGVPALSVDERQIIEAESVSNAMLSCSEGGAEYQTLETGTALAGDFEEYVEQARGNPRYRVTELSITDNVHLPVAHDPVTGLDLPEFVISARSWMDQRRFEQEIGKLEESGRLVPQFRSLTGTVYPDFEWASHCKPWAARKKVLQAAFGIYRGIGADITPEITQRRCKVAADHIVGLDWGIRPMCASVWRVVQSPAGVPDIAWAVDEVTIEDDGTPTKMGLELQRRGYEPKSTVVVADASDNRAASNYRLLKKQGFRVLRPSAQHRRNPLVVDRVNAMNAKILSAANDITLFVDPVACPTLARALQRHTYRENGKLEADEHDHRGAAGGYVIVRFWPAAADVSRLVTGRYAA